MNLKNLFSELVYNVTMMMVTGKRWSIEDYEIFKPGNFMDICDYIPLLKWVGFRGMEKKLINLQRKREHHYWFEKEDSCSRTLVLTTNRTRMLHR